MGTYSSNEINRHYKGRKISDWLDYLLDGELLYVEPINIKKTASYVQNNNNKTIKVNPDSLSVVIDALNGNRISYKLVELQNILLAKDDETSADDLLELITNNSVTVASYANKNKNTPQVARYIYAIRTTFESDSPDKIAAIPGFRSDYEKKAWELLSNDKREEVRIWVAKHRLTPSQIVSNLANDPSKRIRMTVAQRFDLSNQILSNLSYDKDNSVRIAVAMNPYATSEILDRLSLDNNESTKFAVATNSNTPVTVLKSRLLSSKISSISKAAEENLLKRSPNHGRQTDCITLRSIPPLRP